MTRRRRSASRRDNGAATTLNEEISKIAGDAAPVFLAKPTLEAELGISRHADHKPMKIVDRLDELPVEQWPEPLREAVGSLRASVAARPAGPDE